MTTHIFINKKITNELLIEIKTFYKKNRISILGILAIDEDGHFDEDDDCIALYCDNNDIIKEISIIEPDEFD